MYKNIIINFPLCIILYHISFIYQLRLRSYKIINMFFYKHDIYKKFILRFRFTEKNKYMV